MCKKRLLVGLSNVIVLLVLPSFSQCDPVKESEKSVASERTQAIALLFHYMQCRPSNSSDEATKALININKTWKPSDYISKYSNRTDIQNLIDCIARLEEQNDPHTLPGSANPEYVLQLNYVLKVLYFNTEDWPLFYNTCIWLLGRINPSQFTWALMIVFQDKFPDTITPPTMIEIFPQLYCPKQNVLEAAKIPKRYPPANPLGYWTNDPNLHVFHVHWHIANPFWWDASIYKVQRQRSHELFLYMHHQMMCRHNAELLSNNMPPPKPIELRSSFVIEQGYIPVMVNIDFAEFFPRNDSTTLGHFDDGRTINTLAIYHARIVDGIKRGYFNATQSRQISLKGSNGTDIVGATVEASPYYTANYGLYGSLHNAIHTLLGGIYRSDLYRVAGVEASVETAMRDPVFFQIHGVVDVMYLQYKSTMPPYSTKELQFQGIEILTFDILTCEKYDLERTCRRSPQDVNWPLHDGGMDPKEVITLTTFITTSTYDLSTVAKPCRSISEPPVPVTMPILDYVPFSYVLGVKSTRKEMTYAIARIFLWPANLYGDAASASAIELDRVRVSFKPNQTTVLVINSLDSTLTRVEPSPGIKKLYKIPENSETVTKPENRRACAFPNNLLIPRGSAEGIKFKITVFLSELTNPSVIEDPHYALCGACQGRQFPDDKPMGYPFDRPGTRFNLTSTSCSTPNCVSMMKNVIDKVVLIKHDGQI